MATLLLVLCGLTLFSPGCGGLLIKSPLNLTMDHNLFPSLSNGYIGTTLLHDSLYLAGVYVNEVEWLEAVCLQFPSVEKYVNPRGKYELSGLCEKVDHVIQMGGSLLDVLEGGMGSRRARLTSPFAYIVSLPPSPSPPSLEEMYLDTDSMVAGVKTTVVESTSTSITSRYYTHRGYKNVFVFEVTVDNRGSSSTKEDEEEDDLVVTLESITPPEEGLLSKSLPIDILLKPVDVEDSLDETTTVMMMKRRRSLLNTYQHGVNVTCYEGADRKSVV